MQYFIGIVPPEDYQQKIVAFQRRCTNNRLYEVVEPHITVKAQGGLTADMRWLNKIREVCSEFPRFPVSLTEPASFGRDVVYLGVTSNRIFELHRQMVSAVSPSSELIQRYFELDMYTPHLTLGQAYWGMNKSELEDMKAEARTDLRPFPTFTVEYVRIYEEAEPNTYQQFEDIQLA